MKQIDRIVALSFRDQLRDARAMALKDAEAFEEVVFVLERLGSHLMGRQGGLGEYRPFVVELAACSPLFCSERHGFSGVHTPFSQQYDFVRRARNDRMHEGAAARHATSHSIELALVLEDALMNNCSNDHALKVTDFMVRNPVCASMWQPMSFIRQTMLTSSFSCLPVDTSAATNERSEWWLVSDIEVARYLRRRPNGVRPKDLSAQSLEDAIKGVGGNKLTLVKARIIPATATVENVLLTWTPQEGKLGDFPYPVLVAREGSEELLGILSPYDLL